MFMTVLSNNTTCLQGWAMGLESHGICVPGHESRDLGPGLGLILLGRLGLGQISLGQSRDKNLWDSQIPSFGTSWDSSPMGFWSPMGPIEIIWDLSLTGRESLS